MMEINVTEAETKLNQILSQVEQGEEVIITRQGKQIACLSPIQQALQPLNPALSLEPPNL